MMKISWTLIVKPYRNCLNKWLLIISWSRCIIVSLIERHQHCSVDRRESYSMAIWRRKYRMNSITIDGNTWPARLSRHNTTATTTDWWFRGLSLCWSEENRRKWFFDPVKKIKRFWRRSNNFKRRKNSWSTTRTSSTAWRPFNESSKRHAWRSMIPAHKCEGNFGGHSWQRLDQWLQQKEERKDSRSRLKRKRHTRKETGLWLFRLDVEKCSGKWMGALLRGERNRLDKDWMGRVPSVMEELGVSKVRFCSRFKLMFNAFVNRSIVWRVVVERNDCDSSRSFPTRNHCPQQTDLKRIDEQREDESFNLTQIRPRKFKIGFVIVGETISSRAIDIEHSRTLL